MVMGSGDYLIVVEVNIRMKKNILEGNFWVFLFRLLFLVFCY